MNQHAAGALGMNKGDLGAARARTALLVKNAQAFGLDLLNSSVNIVHPHGNMMDALAPFCYPARDVALVRHLVAQFRHSVLQKLEIGLTNPGKGNPQTLIRIGLFKVMDFQAQDVSKDAEVSIQVFYGHANMIDLTDIHTCS